MSITHATPAMIMFKHLLPRFVSCFLRLSLTSLLLSLGACHSAFDQKLPEPGPNDKAKVLGQQPTAKGTRPNVVWILLDACRAGNLSCYGYDRITSPNIDSLAARGVVFEQNYAQSNFTGRSVPSYFTGRYFPVSCMDLFLTGQVQLLRTPPAGEVLFPETMRTNGYHSTLFTAHQLFRETCPAWRVFDEAKLVTLRRAEGLRTFADINADLFPWLEKAPPQPFFLYIHSVDTHFPHTLSPPYDKFLDKSYSTDHLNFLNMGQIIQRKDGQPYSAADREYLRASHDGGILYADTHVGEFIEKLKALGLFENTLFVISADHGDALGEDGQTMAHSGAGISDQVLHVPLIMSGPGIPPGTRVGALTENTDIVPTLSELLQLHTEAEMHGKSLVSSLNNPNVPVHDYVFSWRHSHYYDDIESLVLRTSQYKYEYFLSGSEEHLWQAPDDLSHRVDLLAQKPDVAADLRRRMFEERMPLLASYRALPFTDAILSGPFILRICGLTDAGVESPFDGKLNDALREDNKWAATAGMLWSCAWKENAPEISFRFPIPNGQYQVQVNLYSNRDFSGRPASSLLVKVGSDPEFRTIVRDSLPPETAHFERVDLGEYTIADGVFACTFDEGDRDHWACLRDFRLVPIRDGKDAETRPELHDAQTPEELSEREEDMRALGYIH